MVHDLDMSTMFMSKEKEWERLRGNRGEEKYGTEGEGIFVAETTDSSEQLNRTPCLSGTTNNQSLHNTTEWPQRLMTFETFDQRDEKTLLPTYKPTHLPTYLPNYLPTYVPSLENTLKEQS